MELRRKKLIRELVEGIKVELKISKDKDKDIVYEVVEKLGGTIEKVYFIKGYYDSKLYKEDETFKIEVLATLEEERQKVRIAEELGWLIVTKDYMTDKEKWGKEPQGICQYDTRDYREENVLRLAGELLLRGQDIRKRLDDDNMLDVDSIATEYGLPFSYVKRRAIEEGIIE